jgi:hypothetical protein
MMGNIWVQNKITPIIKWGYWNSKDHGFLKDEAVSSFIVHHRIYLLGSKDVLPLLGSSNSEDNHLEKDHILKFYLSPDTFFQFPIKCPFILLPPWASHWWRLETAMFVFSSILHP